jgi:putative transposase
MSFKGFQAVSLMTLSGRIEIPFIIPGYRQTALHTIKGQGYLFSRKNIFYLFYLAAIMDVPGVLPTAPSMTIDVDFEAISLACQVPQQKTRKLTFAHR